MERLTARQAIKHADGTSHIVTYCHGHRYGPAAFPDKYGTSNPQEYENYCEMVDRLAIYEDIGTVEDFQRLAPKMVSCPKGWQGTRDTRYICPCCKKAVRNDESFCHKCGQALLFPKQVYDKENNKFWLDFGEEAEAALAKEDTANDK